MNACLLEPTDVRVIEGDRPWKGIDRLVLDEAGVTIEGGLVRVPYRDCSDELRYSKVFPLAPREGGPRSWYEPRGVELLPFGLETLPLGSRAVIMAEGESDALALREAYAEGVRTSEGIALGTMPVLALPGARSWKPCWAKYLEPFPVVYVIPDGDAAGRAMAAKIRADVPRARIVQLPEGEDARALLQRKGARALDPYLDRADEDARFEAALTYSRGDLETFLALLRGDAVTL